MALAQPVLGQPDSTKSDKPINFLALPLVFFTPETSLGFGAAGVLNFRSVKDTTVKSSQVLFGGAYTLMRQILTYTNYNLYFDRERYWLKGEFGYYRYFYFYYGTGREARRSDQETYEVEFPRVRLDAMRATSEHSYLGFRYWLDAYHMLKTDPSGALFAERPNGFSGGTISGLGPIFILDTRDNIYSARKGFKVEVAAMLFDQWLGSGFEYFQTGLDASVYLKPWKQWRHVLAAQVMAENQWGDIPFFALSRVGSPRMMRGYYSGRYIDRHQVAGQVEYRYPLFWRLEHTLFASTAFIGGELEAMRLDEAIPAVGTGLRFVVNKADRVKVRFDVAYGETWNFYLTFNEAF